MENVRRIPVHVAIIMDGNGRWAKKRGLPRTAGHAQGARTVEKILEDADHMGIKYLTVYAFSTENWSRPDSEVKALMNLLRTYMKTSLAKCAKNNVKIRVIGDKTRLDNDLQTAIADLERDTANNTGIGFQIAINYGSRDEIVRAVREVAESVRKGLLYPEEINERGSPISFCGRRLTRSCIFAMSRGLTSRRRSWRRQWTPIITEKGAMEA